MNSRERVLAALNHQRARPRAHRLLRPPLVGHRGHRLRPAPQTLWACRSGRSASTIRSSSWPSSTTTCWTGSASTRSSWAAASPWRTSTGPTGCCPTARPARCRPGRCPSASAGRWVLRSDERPGHRPDARRRAVLRADLLAVRWSRRRPATICPRRFEREHVDAAIASPARPARGRARRRRGRWPRAHAGCAHSTDRAIIGLFGGNLLEIGQFLYRIDNFLMLLAGEPARAHAFLDALVEIHLANLERFLGAVGPYIDIILFGDDLGMQTGPQISPAHVPRVLQAAARAHVAAGQGAGRRQGACCTAAAACAPLLPDLIDAGLDAINPVQITCRGMDAGGLKRDFGARHDLLGRRLRHARSPPARHAGRGRASTCASRSRILSPGGGFVFQQVHNILADVPPENIVAMFDAACGTRAGEGGEGERGRAGAGRKGDAIRTTQYVSTFSHSHV